MKLVNKLPNSTPVNHQTCTELELHAYVDGELTDIERNHVEKAAQHSAAISQQLNHLEQLKQMIRDSYVGIEYLH